MNIENKPNLISPSFYSINEAKSIVQEQSGMSFRLELFEEAIKLGIVTVIYKDDAKYLWYDDVNLCIRLMGLNSDITLHEVSDLEMGYSKSLLVKRFALSKSTYLIYDSFRETKRIPAFVRNILYMEDENACESCEATQYDILDTTIVTTNKSICAYLESASYRKELLETSRKSVFANSSSYMGTKKQLIGFIIESMIPFYNDNTEFLDLMCGSGSVSCALTRLGNVYASDSQRFCELLAMVQGAGFSKKRALELIEEIKDDYWKNLLLLQDELKTPVEKENDIFHMDFVNTEKVYDEYKKFAESFELYSSTGSCKEFIRTTIEDRKSKKDLQPYCLFTYYFTNVFFGLSQSMQIDSIRYAIDQIKDLEEKKWALGILVIVASLVATTFVGHFAQPLQIKEDNVLSIINKRRKSAWLEFSRRMIEMASESENCNHRINIVEGPWNSALEQIKDKKIDDLIVYLDAPYKREEYSRYYHVLETLVLYDYPSSENKGRMRSKKRGERFKTEFFTRDSDKIKNAFTSIITEILRNHAVCVWSYSNNGAISIIDVVESVKNSIECNVYFYSIPYKHTAQGVKQKKGMAKIKVIEYCIVFTADKPSAF